MEYKTAFFDYYNRAIKEGLTEKEAYWWAITEDIYDAEDNLLPKDYKRPEPLCYHPDSAIRSDGQKYECYETGTCGICGKFVYKQEFPGKPGVYGWRGERVKIKRRSETNDGLAFLVAMRMHYENLHQ